MSRRIGRMKRFLMLMLPAKPPAQAEAAVVVISPASGWAQTGQQVPVATVNAVLAAKTMQLRAEAGVSEHDKRAKNAAAIAALRQNVVPNFAPTNQAE